jgi:multidrug efflux system membrane fusion protein
MIPVLRAVRIRKQVHPLLLVAAPALLLFSACSEPPRAQSAMIPPAVPVSTGMVVEQMVPLELRSFGTVEPFASVEVKSQVTGQLLTVRFAEGADVKKGDLLFEIDPRPFREALRQAEADLTKDRAELKQAEANLARDRAQLKNAESDAARYAELEKRGVAARMQNEQARTASQMMTEGVRASEAGLESIRAAIESNRAAVARARLDLSFCEIRAPISGRAGNLLIHQGNLVKANDSTLIVINQVTPIFVTFGVPERQLDIIMARNASRPLPVRASFEDSDRVVPGTLKMIDNRVDPATGTIRLKAVFNNEERMLWPGRFVNVVLTVDTQKATVVAAEAVQAGQQGSFVYVVKPDHSVEPRPVTTGANPGTQVIIERGLTPGETVVTDGQSRLYPGARVQTVPAPAPGGQGN